MAGLPLEVGQTATRSLSLGEERVEGEAWCHTFVDARTP